MNSPASFSRAQHPALLAAAIIAALISLLFAVSCNVDTTSVVETESRLTVASIFAVNDDNSVTLGWVNPIEGTPVILSDGQPDPDFPGTQSSTRIYRGDNEDFPLSKTTLLAEVPAGEDRYTDSTVLNGSVYYYRVVPVGDLGGGLEKTGNPSTAAIGQPYDYSAVTTIRYDEHIQRIFTSSCAVSGCHAGAVPDPAPPPEDDHFHKSKTRALLHDEAPAGLSLESWDELMMGGEHGSVVVAYRPERSHLIFHVNDDTLFAPVSLPHKPFLPGFQLPRNQVELLYRWAQEGCRNEIGAVPFSSYPAGRVLVTNQAEDLVAVIDRATNLTGRFIRAGAANTQVTPPEAPHNVTVDEPRGVYYVNLIGSGKVLKYRLDTNELIDQVGGIISPTEVAISSTGDTAYVAQFAPGVNAIKILRTNPLQVIGEVSAPNVDKPHGVQITPDGRELWVTGNLSDNIMVVDLTDLSTRLIQLNNQPPGEGGVLLPYQTAMTSDNRKVYVTTQRGNTVVLVDRLTYEVTKSIPVGLNPLIPSITPDSRFVLVPNRNTNDISVIDTQVDSVVRTIADVGPQPHGSAITSDGRYAYVSCENVTALVPPHHPTIGSRNPGFIAVIDLATMTLKQRFETGAFAAGVAITER
jgi:YVTN family beta-propeller protein